VSVCFRNSAKRGEWYQHEYGQERGSRSRSTRQRHALTRLIEYGKQAPFELGWTRHRYGQKTRRAKRAGRTCDFEKVRSVLGRRSSQRHHVVIARALALGPQPPFGDPDQRMKPVQRADKAGDELSK
jgi:hypothetical protein